MEIKDKKLTDDVIMANLLKKLRYSAKAFATELGYASHTTIHHILKGRNGISPEMANRIITKFPEVNFFYLSKGELPILNGGKLAQNQNNLFSFGLDVEEIKGEENIIVLRSIDRSLKQIVEMMRNKKSDL